jgi:hypothetical protein
MGLFGKVKSYGLYPLAAFAPSEFCWYITDKIEGDAEDKGLKAAVKATYVSAAYEATAGISTLLYLPSHVAAPLAVLFGFDAIYRCATAYGEQAPVGLLGGVKTFLFDMAGMTREAWAPKTVKHPKSLETRINETPVLRSLFRRKSIRQI